MMTMNFDMGASNLGSGVNTNATLAPNEIHEVIFKGVEYATSKDGKWEFMRIKFQGKKGGFYTDPTFGFGKDGGVRQKTQYGENPSPYESFMMKVKHLLTAVAPELLNKMVKGEITVKAKTFKDYVTGIGELLKEYEGAETNIKLVSNNKGEASFPPFFAGLSKDGETYIKSDFIGDNLSFTSKERENAIKKATARPTAMPNTTDDLSLEVGSSSTDSSDLLNMDI